VRYCQLRFAISLLTCGAFHHDPRYQPSGPSKRSHGIDTNRYLPWPEPTIRSTSMISPLSVTSVPSALHFSFPSLWCYPSTPDPFLLAHRVEPHLSEARAAEGHHVN
jgi:hypothetical protein